MEKLRPLLNIRRGMGFKFLLISVSISLVVVLASSFLILTVQRQQIINSAENETTHLSEVIEASLEYPLQNNNWEMADQIVQNEGIGAAIEKIKILDATGEVRISTLDGEVGRTLDYTDPSCQFCHTDGNKPESLTRIVDLGGQNMLLNVNMLRDQYACPTCSPDGGKILGVLFIEKPLTELNNDLLAAFWRIVAVGLFTFMLLVALLLFTYHRLVLHPVQDINRGVSAISAGDLDVAVPVNRQDELGELAQAFNAMRGQLKSSRVAMEQRSRERTMINEIAVASGEMLDHQRIMELALETVIQQLGMHSGLIFLYDEESERFTLQASRGVTQEVIDKIEMHRLGSGPDISGQVVQTQQVYFIPNMATESYFQDVWEELNDRSYVNIPLISRGKAIGTLSLLSYTGQPFQEDRLEILRLVGHVIGIAIDNALLLAGAHEHEREARQIYELVARASASLELEQVVEAIAQDVRQIMAADLCLVGFVDENREEIVFTGMDGARSSEMAALRIPVKGSWLSCLEQQPNGLQVIELGCDPILDELKRALTAEGVVSILIKPLHRKSKLIGLILVGTTESHHFLKKEILRLDRVAQQVVVAVENAALYGKVGFVATLEERERLAREMHDSLAQALGYF